MYQYLKTAININSENNITHNTDVKIGFHTTKSTVNFIPNH